MLSLLFAGSVPARAQENDDEFPPTSSRPLTPDPSYLSPPEIVEPLYACGERVSVRGVAPGAKVDITINGSPVVSEVAESGDWTITLPAPLAVDDIVGASQSEGGARSDEDQATAVDHRNDFPTLPRPSIWDEELPLYECARYVAVTDFVPGSTIEVVDRAPLPGGGFGPEVRLGGWASAPTHSWGATTFSAPGLARDHEVKARYALCADISGDSLPQTVQPEPASLPQLTTEICEWSYGSGRPPQAVFRNHTPGATVDVFVDGSPYATIVGPTTQVDLYDVRVGASVTAVQRLCAVQSMPSIGVTVPPASVCADLPPAEIQAPNVGDDAVTVLRSVPKARITIFANGQEIGDGGGSRIRLRRRIAPGDVLDVLQQLESCKSQRVHHLSLVCKAPLKIAREEGPFHVGTIDYFLPGVVKLQPSGLEVTFQGTIRFPAVPGSEHLESVPGHFPLVVVLHGRHGRFRSERGDSCKTSGPFTFVQNHKGYGYLLDRLASFGYVVASIDANDINCSPGDGQGTGQITERAELVKRHMSFFAFLNDVASSPIPWPTNPMVSSLQVLFAGRIDVTRVALIGHSRGAEAVVRAAEQCRRGHSVAECGVVPAGMSVESVISIAPTDALQGSVDEVPLLMILPANDGDLCDNPGAAIYDRADGGGGGWFKSQLYYYGANHNFFNTEWGNEWDLPDRCGAPHPVTAPGPDLPMPDQQRAAFADWAASFLEATLRGRDDLRPIFSGDGNLVGLDPGATVLPSYRRAGSLLIDDHEDAMVLVNNLGGRVEPTDFGIYDELSLRPLALHRFASFVHDTTGAIGSWGRPSDVRSDLNGRDGSGVGVLSLRLAQVNDSANQRNRPMVLDLEFEDARGSRSVVVPTSEVVAIPFVYAHPFATKSMLHTLRVPLGCFGAPDNFDLGALGALSIRTSMVTPTGVVALDDLELSD